MLLNATRRIIEQRRKGNAGIDVIVQTMSEVEDLVPSEPHVPVVKQFFEQAAKYSRSGVFQLKKAANAIGIASEEKSVTLTGWLDFCNFHLVRRRFRIVEADLTAIFSMCRVSQSEIASDSLSKDQFQQCLIMLGSKVGLLAPSTKTAQRETIFSHGAAFDSLVGVIVMLEKEFAHAPEPWKPLLVIIPKMKLLFQKVAKNSKDPIGSLGKSGSLISCREFVFFYEEQQINQKFAADISNSKLMHIFKKSQINENSEKSQCDLKEFSYAVILLAVELRILDASHLEFYGHGGDQSIFDECDPDTGHIVKDFVQQLLGLPSKSEHTENAMKKNASKTQRLRNVSLLGESRLEILESAPNKETDALKRTEYHEPADGTLSSKKIDEIVSKGYIYRRSKTRAFVADATVAARDLQDTGKGISSIEDVEFNPILDLLEDDCIEVIKQTNTQKHNWQQHS
jgi:hypothetical protein